MRGFLVQSDDAAPARSQHYRLHLQGFAPRESDRAGRPRQDA